MVEFVPLGRMAILLPHENKNVLKQNQRCLTILKRSKIAIDFDLHKTKKPLFVLKSGFV